ncbi:MAG: spermidine synthase [Chloroflexi bacterium]|nr:spermidine synthase [Chloroflexota bacterium]
MGLPPGDWYTEPVRRNLLHSLRLESTILSTETAYQAVQIIQTDPFGRTLVLDGKTQSAESDECIYHEALVHPAMLAHPEPRSVFIAGGGEGATLREALAHRTVERAVMADLDAELVEICKEHLPSWHRGAFDDPRTELICVDAVACLTDQPPGTFDVIIIDVTDPAEGGPSVALFTRAFYRMALSRLSPGGVLVTQAGPATFGMASVFTAIYSTIKREAGSVIPYFTEVPSFGGNWGFLMACAGEAPKLSVEEIDRRIHARVSSRLRCYDGPAHQGMFGVPKWLREELDAETHIISPDTPIYLE